MTATGPNDRNRRLTEEQSLSELVSVVEGNFEELPFGSGSFDVVWSQDAILHSANRRQVLPEVARVLVPGGTFVCTDPMQTENADEATLAPVLERLNLSSLANWVAAGRNGAPAWGIMVFDKTD